jgi:ZIP family zinc transporter
LVEPVGGAIGAGAVALSSALLPWALGFAGGAMLFVISSEVIPETHRPGYERGATAALFTGFGAMFFLAATLS